MKALKILGIFLLVIIGIPLIASFFMPSEVRIERTATIEAPAKVVFAQINNLQNMSQWTVWEQRDTNMVIEYSDPAEGVGAKSSWVSEQEGSGTQTIIESVENQKMVSELDFGDQGTAVSIFTLEETDGGTQLTWAMDADMGSNPIGKIMGMFMDGMVGPDFEEGLSNLNELSKSIPIEPDPVPVEISTVDVPGGFVVTVTDSGTIDQLSAKMGEMFGKVMGAIDTANMGGAPFSIWHKWNPEGMSVFEAGVPVLEAGESDDMVVAREMEGTKAITATHMGAYDASIEVYDALGKYAEDNGLTVIGAPWEVYITDPSTEPDTTKWQTNIYFPIQ
jgi:effector-binding domain-containing protein